MATSAYTTTPHRSAGRISTISVDANALRRQRTLVGRFGCRLYRFIISGLSVQMPTTGSVASRSSTARRSSCHIIKKQPFAHRARDKIRRDEMIRFV